MLDVQSRDFDIVCVGYDVDPAAKERVDSCVLSRQQLSMVT
jgi:hypothetical protein